VIRCLNGLDIGLPELSRAGVNFARLDRILQVVESSDLDPLEADTLQLDTRPLVPICSTTETVPCSSLSIACDG
jgi:hypothetical protein